MRVHQRRVQQTGGSTLTVSLPKLWAERFGLERGGEVIEIEGEDRPLILMPKNVALSDGELVIEPGTTLEQATRMLISLYLAGYETIVVSEKGGVAIQRALKNLIRRWLVGVEVVDERLDGMVLSVMRLYENLTPLTVLERMGTMAANMVHDGLSLLEDPSPEEVADLLDRDDEVDRFYHYLLRSVNASLIDPRTLKAVEVPDPQVLIGYTLVARSVERVADHATTIASISVDKSWKFEPIGDFYGVCLESEQVFRKAVELVLKPDHRFALSSLESTDELLTKLELSFSELQSRCSKQDPIVLYRMLFDNVKRVVEYSMDMFEIALNLTTPKPRMIPIKRPQS
ncbi:MAG: phosphate uptake regulator PhoU [Thaumarchaeota archaeon]|nr:phosphate uptake regulator PhoU [Candidatus Calditenuaceae archaeon]MDW8186671.1 phosphate uptake regulator PhoU [Nitrososphaerota archaeon]